mmetsp:Transcript_23489/g.60408  ORF Transcript_23489/g.60408 Transcript_23489/m.60408 type:complete len:277 (+) Transcript_23489:208-1038(+)
MARGQLHLRHHSVRPRHLLLHAPVPRRCADQQLGHPVCGHAIRSGAGGAAGADVRDHEYRDHVDRATGHAHADYPHAVGHVLLHRRHLSHGELGETASARWLVRAAVVAQSRLHSAHGDARDDRGDAQPLHGHPSQPIGVVEHARGCVRLPRHVPRARVPAEDVLAVRDHWRRVRAARRHVHPVRRDRDLAARVGRLGQDVRGDMGAEHAADRQRARAAQLALRVGGQLDGPGRDRADGAVHPPRVVCWQARRPARPARRRAREGAAREGHPAARP